MSEPTREEMIAYIDYRIKRFRQASTALHGEWIEGEDDLLIAIRRLIEHGPKVSREFVEKWKDKIVTVEMGGIPPNTSTTPLQEIRVISHVEEMLREAGVTVKEDEDE